VGANPVDHGKPGSKLHLVCDGNGLLLTAAIAATSVNDSTIFLACWTTFPRCKAGAPWRPSRRGPAGTDAVRAAHHLTRTSDCRAAGVERTLLSALAQDACG
jgi:hypothetical protein